MKHWERVRIGLKCAYGCQIPHAEWAYMRGRFAVCEPCARKQGIVRLGADDPPAVELEPVMSLADIKARLAAIAARKGL